MTHPLPTAFLGAPALAPRIGPTPIAAFTPPAPVLAGHPSGSRYLPATLDPMLTVRPGRHRHDRVAQDVVTLTKALLGAIPALKGGAPVELVPPHRRGGTWYLDARATATRRVERQKGRFAIPALSREHYLTPTTNAPGVKSGLHGAGSVRPFLTFVLGRELENHPGYYELLPLRPTA